MSSNRKNKAQQIEFDKNVLDLRLAGYTYQEIGVQIARIEGRDTPYTPQYVGKVIRRVLSDRRAVVDESVDELQRVQFERTERMFTKAYTQAMKGHLGAMEKCLKIMERQAKLLGLDKPAKTAFTDSDGGELEEGNIIFYVPDNGRG